jgi:hypothetical protein
MKKTNIITCFVLLFAVKLPGSLVYAQESDSSGAKSLSLNRAEQVGKGEYKELVKRGCERILDVKKGRSFIYKHSAPMRAGGRTYPAPIVGFRKEPTLILNARIGSTKGAKILDSKGTTIGSCPWAVAHGHSGGRYRCTMSTSSLRRKAIKSSGKPAIFFTLNKKSCAKVEDAGRCIGSVKGLCNQTIR